MKRLLKFCFALGLGSCGLAACQGPGQTAPATAPAALPGKAARPVPAAAPDPPLLSQQLGTSGLWLSLPATYRLTTTDGPDFLVYYFAPADTTVQTSYSGGLYLGGHPQGFTNEAGCQQRRVAVPVLGRPAPFTVQRCATGYTLDAVFDSGRSQSFDSKINAFGSAKSAAELRQLLAVFATLRRRPAAAGRPR